MNEEFLYGIAALVLLMLPGLVARIRKHKRANSIFILSVIGLAACAVSVLGGLIIWVFALIWAASNLGAGKNQA